MPDLTTDPFDPHQETEQMEAEPGLAQEASSAENRRRRLWWIIAVLLLLLLVGCAVLQFLLPTARSGRKGETKVGITPVFGVYGLHQPLGVSSGPDGEIVVSDTGVQRAYVYDPTGVLSTRLGDDQPGSKIFSPNGSIWVGETIYLCDWTMRRVWMLDPDGKVRGFFPQDPTSDAYGESGFTPYDIARLGDDFLVTSADGIYRFSGADGTLVGRFEGSAGDGTDELKFPNGIAINPDGDAVYVCDTLNRRVVAFDSAGNRLWSLGRPDQGGRISGFFGLPRGVTVTDRGVLVSDTFGHRLVLLDRDGQLLGTYGTRGVLDAELNFPEALDVAPDGLIYIADRENNRIQVVELGDPVAADAATQKKWQDSFEVFTNR